MAEAWMGNAEVMPRARSERTASACTPRSAKDEDNKTLH
jgi:hypothetical protein